MCGSCGKGTTTRGGFRKIKKGDKLKALTYEQLKAKIIEQAEKKNDKSQ